MQNIELASERAARLALERRRDREAERRARVFNDKVRTMGVDRDALDEQVRERRRREEKVKQDQAALECGASPYAVIPDAEALRHSKAAGVLQMQQVKQKLQLEKALHAFRGQNQQAWTRTEFDLSDPSDAQMILPGLVGEDPTQSSRRQRQKEQLREWLVQQQAEREASRAQREREEQKHNQSREEARNRAGERQHLQEEQRRRAAIATKHYNLTMTEEKHRLKEQNHPDYVLESAAVPGFSPSVDARPPPETVQQVIQFQKDQIQEKKRREDERKRQDERLDRVRLDSARAALLMERQQARISKQLRRQLDSTNAQLAQAHEQQKPDLQRGQIHESFFCQFNTSSR